MTGLRALIAGLAGAAAIAAAGPGVGAALTQSLETSVKANFLARFAGFVQWPEGALRAGTAPITVCVVGHDPFGAVLDDALADQTVHGRRLTARRIDRIAPDSGCHIAYLGGSSAQSVADGVAAVAGQGVLTVTDEARGTSRGVIHFALFQNRVRFHVDNRLARRGRLDVSSRLLALAISVREN